MAITVGDAVEHLKQFPPETPIYWGIEELPCWITCAEATAGYLEVLFRREKGSQNEYLYMISPSHVADLEDLADEYRGRMHRLQWSFWSRLKFLFRPYMKV